MKLIVNADDFGLSKAVNYGIIDAHLDGVVTSTTMMITMPAVDHAIEQLGNAPNLKVGLHLNMTFGKPITNCPSLVKSNGEFYKPKEKPDASKFNKKEIYDELMAQYDLFVKKMNKKPTHLDSHLYAHQLYPIVSEVVYQIAIQKNIPVRDLVTPNYKPVKFFGWFKMINEKNDLSQLLIDYQKVIIKEKIGELMVHPAYLDEFVENNSTYNIQRTKELSALINPLFKKFLLDNEITLISYADVEVTNV